MSTVQLDVLDSNPATRTPTLRAAYGCFPSGVIAVCALRNGQPVGMAASSFVAVSMEPALVSVCVQHTSTTWPQLADRPRLGLSVLGAGHDAACLQLAAKTGNRFAGLDWSATDDGAVFLQESATWLDCSIDQIVPAGDHDIVLLRVEGLEIHEGVGPLVYHASGFHNLRQPTTVDQ
ncbi:flavin reductase family protein [Nocardioides sp. NPDC051685]|uniref:flavin reductase family protein n=1 Tax=Nocardioides sp. NPDC051685 TaxID=3364334 RepID=UPI0037B53ADB